MVNYRSPVIGGGDSGIYRGDSHVCSAAIHAGVISQSKGGCGRVRRTGEWSNYTGVEQNGISSIEYLSDFPMSFTFDRLEDSSSKELKCGGDARWPLFGFSVAVSVLLSLCVTSPVAFYSSIFFMVYFQDALVSDAPYFPDYYEVVSTALGRFLPTAFVGVVIYRYCVKRTLTSLDAHWSKTILWLGGCWVAALNSDTFDKIPISRLTPHDIRQQPGAVAALITIVAILLLITIGQVVAFRNEGRLITMLKVYTCMALCLLALLVVPHMQLRLHHYILGLVFVPGTSLQTRPSLLYQGLCVGLFVNGIARWNYDSILQTPASLLGDAEKGTVLPQLTVPVIFSNQTLSFDFSDRLHPDVDGISVLVNDVLRFRAFRPSEAGDLDNNTQIEAFNWTRRVDGHPEYFRFGFVETNTMGGVGYDDFTDPAVWEVNGDWKWSNSTKSGNADQNANATVARIV